MPARRVEPEPRRFDSTAFLLLGIGLVLSAAVLSANAADFTGDWSVVRTSTNNWLGPAGAWMARSLVESLGSAVYVFLTAWVVVATGGWLVDSNSSLDSDRGSTRSGLARQFHCRNWRHSRRRPLGLAGDSGRAVGASGNHKRRHDPRHRISG
jgi:hypothetical protein